MYNHTLTFMTLDLLLFVLSLLAYGCNESRGVVNYYSPVFKDDGQKIAYIKRVAHYSTEEKGFGFQSKLSFTKDQLMLCMNNLQQTNEKCVEHWDLPLKKANDFSKGDITAILNWEDNELKYRIDLIRFDFDGWEFGQPDRDYSSGPKRIIANININENIENNPTTYDSLIVRVDLDPKIYAYPFPNKIVVEVAKTP